MQRHKITRKFCKSCDKETKFEKDITAMGCGDLVLVILTLGIWLIIRSILKPGYKCSECGGK